MCITSQAQLQWCSLGKAKYLYPYLYTHTGCETKVQLIASGTVICVNLPAYVCLELILERGKLVCLEEDLMSGELL